MRFLIALTCALALAACATNPQRPGDEGIVKSSPADIYVQKGVQYMEKGRLDVALMDLQHALKLDSRHSGAHNAIAVLYEQLKESDKAGYHYERAVDLDPANPRALNNYGRFLCARGNYDKGLTFLSKAFDMPLYRHPWIALTNAGNCAFRADRMDVAERYLRRALDKNPRFAPALKEMVQVSLKQGNYLSARAFLQRFQEVGEHTPETLWLAIQTENALGDKKAVANYISTLRAKYPGSKEAARAREQFSGF